MQKENLTDKEIRQDKYKQIKEYCKDKPASVLQELVKNEGLEEEYHADLDMTQIE